MGGAHSVSGLLTALVSGALLRADGFPLTVTNWPSLTPATGGCARAKACSRAELMG